MNYPVIFKAPDVEAGVCSDAESDAVAYIVRPVQTHSVNIAVIERGGAIPGLEDTDALISLCAGVGVGVRTADCVPVLLYAPDLRAVAAIHAGWKGSIAGIVSRTVERLKGMGANPELMQAVIGPCICCDCYEVSVELADSFRREGFGDCISGERHLDLVRVNLRRLIAGGLRRENVQLMNLCTKETPELPSWRRDKSARRLLTWIRIKS